MARNPRVSVVIPTHNRAHYLATAIDSVLAQSFADLELIVIDDASSDDTQALVAGYADPRIRLSVNARNLGIPGSRNRGLELARGEYLAALDSDDYAYPKRLERQVAFLDRHRDHAVIGSWASWMNQHGQPRAGIKRRPLRAADAAAALIFRSCLQQPSVTARTAVLREYGYRDSFDLSSDYDLWVRMAERHRMASLPEVLVCCRSHDSSTTRGAVPRVFDRQRAIYRYQLDALGMAYDEHDVERHRLLTRPGKHDSAPEAGELEWAEDWLLRLRQANTTHPRYDPRAFDRVLGFAWGAACYRATQHDKARTLRRFFASPLRAASLAGIRQQLALVSMHRPLRAGGARPAPARADHRHS